MDRQSPPDRSVILQPVPIVPRGSTCRFRGSSRRGSNLCRFLNPGILSAVLWLVSSPVAHAFCGFYVGRADASLFNDASQVVLVRDGDRTVISMLNDYQGDLKEFALIVPVPVVLEKGQFHVGAVALIKHLDAYSAPRLVEYFDDNPCAREMAEKSMAFGEVAGRMAVAPGAEDASRSLGVSVEAQYTVGEYDIVILSARESDGLETWLRVNG